ncbi:DNRLRE domain-containing protein [Chondrinema litorale]|uniref:DNRLRE domain-containing protein n=1 Tax=Chondrinema litorale TaxID=2994555 RepID=UPI00254384BA|nr:DNRLRE domain-containing protein [Chondrinema litorale]UZR96585.1 DNRLRE domain-containing protein [Chondrinema litorale]
MNRLVVKLVFAFLIGILSSCVKEYDCDVIPVDNNNLIDDGFTSINNTSLITQLNSETIEELTVQNDGLEKNTYIKFNDFTKVEDHVKSASLKLYIKGNYISSSTAYSLLVSAINEDWDESTLSYNNNPSTTMYSTKIFTLDTLTDKKLFEIDVTDLLNDQYENELSQFGFNLALSIEGENEIAAVTFYSSDNEESAYWPSIEVEYGEAASAIYPQIYYSSVSDWGGAWLASNEIYKLSYSSDDQQYSNELITEYQHFENSVASFSINDLTTDIKLYFYNTYQTDDEYIHIIAENYSDENTSTTYSSSEINQITAMDQFGGIAYLAAKSTNGSVHILKVDVKNETKEIIYENSVSGEELEISDFKIEQGMLYWIETDEISGTYRIMVGTSTFSETLNIKTLYDNSNFDTGFKPNNLAVDYFGSTMYLSDQQGVFYQADRSGSGDINEITITSDYLSNITDLEVYMGYLYWMNSSEDENKGGILRVNASGGDSELLFDEVISGYGIEIVDEDDW